MAPRRGSSGGSSSGGSSIRQCQQNDAFSSVGSQVTIAFIAIFFIVYAVQLWQVFRRRSDCKAGWVPLFISILSMLISVTIYLIILPMEECGSMSYGGYGNSLLAVGWLQGVTAIAMMGTMLVPLCKLLMQGGKIVLIINGIYTAFLAILYAAGLAVQTAITVDDTGSYYYSNWDLRRALNGLNIALNVFMVLGVLLTALVIIVQVVRKRHLRQGRLPIYLFFVIFFALAYTLSNLVWYVTVQYVSRPTVAGQLAVFVLYYFFYAGVIAFLLLALTARELTVERKFPGHVAPAPAAYGPQYQFVPQGAR